VGSINPEREARRRGADSDPLRLFERDFQLTACCRRSGCAHRRELTIGLLIRAFGREATLGQVAARMRCAKCGMRGAQIVVKYTGRWGDGR
jgi:hypothetical protein